MSIHARPMTADELYVLPDDHMRHELVRGELTTRPFCGALHGMTAVNVASEVATFVEKNKLGVGLMCAGFVLSRNPDTVRAPDIAFVSKASVDRHGIPPDCFGAAPDLAIEIIEYIDTPDETAVRIQDYLVAGSQEVWAVDCEDRTVVIHRAGGEVLTLSEEDTLDGGALLPGFTCRVVEFFEPY